MLSLILGYIYDDYTKRGWKNGSIKISHVLASFLGKRDLFFIFAECGGVGVRNDHFLWMS